ncbi:TIGR04141 family sporadically distributed protein [Aestuariibacter sp. AA17]|uniref:TIGR04141 family sporadically distributed protein n=1 Tax=Fluctibacter corallii TaxID=2984329 RepID=A0ABT3AD95_9ALTE|nr:TIGR04141 family sporadically distributed protein [Aestuariibacter sp. AA17]MCV2886654.1 TIGR04141 family sporadically distributed protein [Aestuariibacter sp. AA17]
MKRNVVAFLSKENVALEDVQDKKKQFSTHQKDSEDDLILCLSSHYGKAEWASLFSDYEISSSHFDQKSVKGAFFVKVDKRYVIFTFGHGRSLIDKSSIERGFGLRVSMNLGNPEQLKSIDKSTLDKVARNTRSQVALNSGIQDFDFEFDHEILKSITAIVSSGDEDLEMVSGNDSVSLYTEIEASKFKEIAERLVDAYFSDKYKEKYPWAEFIGLESDPDIIEQLEAELIKRFKSNNTDGFWLAPPKIIDYENFSGFVYSTRSIKNNAPCKHPELKLEAFLAEAPFKSKATINIATLKSKTISLYDGNDQHIESIRFFDSLNGELEKNGLKYVLNDGRWYHIKQSFAHDVESYFDNLPRWNGFEDKPYRDRRECCYLRRVADNEQIAVLDQHWIRQKSVAQNYEFCDLFTQCNRIIHVKHYGGSSVLSHLFAQATMSLEMMLNCPEVIPQIKEHLEETYISFDFSPSESRVHKIVLAIIYPRSGELNIPFFSKVNLRHRARDMQNKGFTVELAKIPVDNLALQNISTKSKCACKAKTAKCTKSLTDLG